MKLKSENTIKIDLSDKGGVGPLVHREGEVTLRRPAQYGVCLWWSDEQPCFVHPDDQETVERLVPGNRVFKKEECVDFADRKLGYSRLSYGDQVFRALPTIWYPFPTDSVVKPVSWSRESVRYSTISGVVNPGIRYRNRPESASHGREKVHGSIRTE